MGIAPPPEPDDDIMMALRRWYGVLQESVARLRFLTPQVATEVVTVPPKIYGVSNSDRATVARFLYDRAAVMIDRYGRR